jgi:hypothetical protein
MRPKRVGEHDVQAATTSGATRRLASQHLKAVVFKKRFERNVVLGVKSSSSLRQPRRARL